MLFVTMNYVLMSVFEKARSYFPAFLYRTKVTLIKHDSKKYYIACDPTTNIYDGDDCRFQL